MSRVQPVRGPGVSSDFTPVRLLGLFAGWRLEAYGLAIFALYAALLGLGYHGGVWLANGGGRPIFSDFTTVWVAGRQALLGHAAVLYDPSAFVALQKAIVAPHSFYYSIWPYPPTYLLILAPLGPLPYQAAFLAYEGITLAAAMAVVWLVVRRRPALALVLASPFTAWNFLSGQSGLLTASLLGAALLALERRPVLAGLFLGMLTYKPQFGIFFPIALLAGREWRAISAALVAAAMLATLSIVAFGAEIWAAWPRELAAQSQVNLMADPQSRWGLLHSAYGLVRDLGGSGVFAWVVQGLVTAGSAIVVALVWRSRLRYPLKAASLGAAALLATPYAFAYDLAALAIPVAFLAKDQLQCGVLRGEQTALLALFAIALAVFPTIGAVPVGFVVALGVFLLVLRRALGSGATEGVAAPRPMLAASLWRLGT